ncbi:extracellular solute-binding protein [Schleiferilactobacillus harbinensis]|jgi:putative spermidine/putrescine transport system substrate-binding protein|nr:ABC transporter substrate-binding protein [Schleiferilactobacillus harbinensis]QFR63959.1 extracellular solute-binding protein [Schleiferilactobacillus harbinensis]
MKKFSRAALSVAVLAVTVLFAGCGSKAAASGGSLSVSTFGLSTKQMTSDIFDPFSKQSGTKVQSQFGDSSQRFTQVAHNPNAAVDVIELSQNNALSGNKKNLFKKLDFSKIKNFNTLSSAQQKLAKETNSVPYTVNSIGIIYDPSKTGKITSWDQLWSGKLKGKIAIPDITTTFGPAMLYVAGDHAGTPVTKDNGKAAFKALADLKPNVVKTYTQSSDLANMFKSGEITAAVVGDFAVGMIQAADSNAVYTVPASGTYANYDTASILKSSKNTKAAYAYLSYRLSKTAQAKAAEPKSLNNAPVNDTVKLSAANAKNKTYGAIAKRAKTIDFDYVNSHLSGWIKTWNSLMNK